MRESWRNQQFKLSSASSRSQLFTKRLSTELSILLLRRKSLGRSLLRSQWRSSDWLRSRSQLRYSEPKLLTVLLIDQSSMRGWFKSSRLSRSQWRKLSFRKSINTLTELLRRSRSSKLRPSKRFQLKQSRLNISKESLRKLLRSRS